MADVVLSGILRAAFAVGLLRILRGRLAQEEEIEQYARADQHQDADNDQYNRNRGEPAPGRRRAVRFKSQHGDCGKAGGLKGQDAAFIKKGDGKLVFILVVHRTGDRELDGDLLAWHGDYRIDPLR